MKQNDKSIFLHRTNYSDSSLILTFFTYNKGIQKFIFQGGKRKSHSLFPLSLNEITFYRRPDSELGKLTEASPYILIQSIPTDVYKSTIAFFMVDVLYQCVKTDEQDASLFTFLEHSILMLENTTDISFFTNTFLISLTKHLGIEPHLEEVNCKHFLLQDGGFSNFNTDGELTASGESVQIIQTILRGEELSQAQISVKADVLDVLIEYYKLHIPKFDVKQTLDVIKEILYK